MKRRWKTLLVVTLLLLVAVVAAGGAAVAGWFPPFNRWVEQRLIAELSALGVETDAVHVQELSWRRAVVGPVELQLPGLGMRATEARAELGWEVWRGRVAPQVVLSGLEIELRLDRLDELRKALRSDGSVFPYGSVTIEQSRIILRHGDRRWELPFEGRMESSVADLLMQLRIRSPNFSAQAVVKADLAAETIALELRDGRVEPDAWLPLLRALAPQSPALPSEVHLATTGLSAAAGVAAGRLQSATATVSTSELRVRDGAKGLEAAKLRAELRLQSDGAWRLETTIAELTGSAPQGSVKAADLRLVVDPRNGQFRFGWAEITAAGARLRLNGRVDAAFTPARSLASARTELHVDSAAWDVWKTVAPFDLAARWDGATLNLSSAHLGVAGPAEVQLLDTELAINGLRENRLQITGRTVAGTEPFAWLGTAVRDYDLQPAKLTAAVSFVAALEPGKESVRVEFGVKPELRSFRWPEGKGSAILGAKGTLTADRSFASGRLECDASQVEIEHGGNTVKGKTATLRVQLPRTWWKALASWPALPPDRRWREMLWAGDFDVSLEEGSLLAAEGASATGLNVRARGRGAELFENGGLDLGVTAETVRAAGVTARDPHLQVVAGLEGLRLTASSGIDDFPPHLVVEQTVRWTDGLEVTGTFGFPETVFSGTEPWVRFWPALGPMRLAGVVEVKGRNRFSAGQWSADGELGLREATFHWGDSGTAIEGLAGRLALTNAWPPRAEAGQRLSFSRAQVGGVELTNGAAEFAVDGLENVRVEKLETDVFGGHVAAGAFAFDPRQPAFTTKVKVAGARLEQVLRLFRDVPAEASGAVEGEVPLGWQNGRLTIGTGFLGLAGGEVGRVHFTRDLQPLTAGRSPSEFQYALLRKIETAILELHFNRLRIDTYPANTPGRSLQIRLLGIPVGGDVSAPVSFDLNVNAPLENFLNWGMSSDLHLSGAH